MGFYCGDGVETPTQGALETFTTTPQNPSASRQPLAV